MSVFFQNCSSPYTSLFSSTFQKESSNSSTEGNGTGYDGKLGLFYSYLPDFNCEGKESFYSQVSTTDDQIKFLKNSSLQCGSESKTITPAEIVYSPFQNSVIGYQENIFQRSESIFESIPNDLVEAWCMPTEGETNFEVIQNYKRNDQSATAKIYFSENQKTRLVPVVETSRVVEKTSAQFTASNYSLRINRQQMTSALGTYAGQLSVMIDGATVNKNLSCRLGGYLNTQLWPAKVVVDENINSTIFMQKGNKVYAPVKIGSVYKMVQRDLTTDRSPSLLPNMPISGYGADVFVFSPDKKYLIYRDYQRALYSYNLETESAKRITPYGPGVDFQFKVLEDQVYYIESNTNVFQDRLMRVGINGSNPTVIYDTGVTTSATHGIKGYLTSVGTSRIVYGATDPKTDLIHFYSQLNNSNTAVDITPTFPNLSYMTPVGTYSHLIGIHQDHLINSALMGTTTSFQGWNMIVQSLDGTSQVSLDVAGISNLIVNAPGGDSIYLSATIPKPGTGFFVTTSEAYILKTDTWIKRPAPVLTDVVASSSNKSFVGFNGEKIIRVDSTWGTSEQVCHEVSSPQKIIAADNSNIYIVSGTTTSTAVYRLNDSNSCSKISEVPLPIYQYPSFILAPDQKSAVILTGHSPLPGPAIPSVNFKNMMFWIPLNGQAPVKITTPEIESTNSYSLKFADDSKSVLFVSSPFGGIQKLFQWKFPDTISTKN